MQLRKSQKYILVALFHSFLTGLVKILMLILIVVYPSMLKMIKKSKIKMIQLLVTMTMIEILLFPLETSPEPGTAAALVGKV